MSRAGGREMGGSSSKGGMCILCWLLCFVYLTNFPFRHVNHSNDAGLPSRDVHCFCMTTV